MRESARRGSLTVVAMALVISGAGWSGTGWASDPPSPPLHPALERLKSLEGEWAGPATWDQGGRKGSVEFRLAYKVTAAGKTLVETMFPGTPGEMITVYYVDGEDLVLVHYCTSGNQPRMELKPSTDPNDLSFRCVGGSNMKERDSHMHSARIRIIDADHIAGEWSSTENRKVKWVAEAQLERRK